MKRRAFLTGAAGATGASLAAKATPAVAARRLELTMLSLWPRQLPGLAESAQRLAQRITDGADSKIRVTVLQPGDLVPPFETFDAVANGKADFYYGAEYLWHFKSPAFSLLSGVPYGLTTNEFNAWIHHGGGQQHWDKLSASFNLKPFLAGNLGGQMGGWFNRKIETPEDLQGLRISVPGLAGAALRNLGAEAVSTPPETLHSALESGFLDAAVGLGPWTDHALGLNEVAKHYYYPGFHQPGTALSCVINLDTWSRLSPNQQILIEHTCGMENDWVHALFTARNGEALRTLRRQNDVTVRHFPNSVLTAIGTAAGKVVAQTSTNDPAVMAIYRSFLSFRRRAMSLSKLTDQSFTQARLLPFRYDQS